MTSCCARRGFRGAFFVDGRRPWNPRVKAKLDKHRYKTVSLSRTFHGDWNYTLRGLEQLDHSFRSGLLDRYRKKTKQVYPVRLSQTARLRELESADGVLKLTKPSEP